jgi:hypothetical protein
MRSDVVVRVRHAVYRSFAEGDVPRSAPLADSLRLPLNEVALAYARLHEAHAVVLDPHSSEVRMALPFSAVPTPHRVVSGARSWFANCAWDAFAIPLLLSCDARIDSTCADCGAPLIYRIEQGRLRNPHGVAHFAVPAAKWWDDIVLT